MDDITRPLMRVARSSSIDNMLDLKYIKENIAAVKENTHNRKAQADPELVVALYDQRGGVLRQIEKLRRERNQNAASMKARLPEQQRAQLTQRGRQLKHQIDELNGQLSAVETELNQEALRIPNMSHSDCPIGASEEDNREVRRWGGPPQFGFKALDHVEIGKRLDILDFDTAAKVAGQKFYYLKHQGVFLEWALVKYAFDVLLREGFTITMTPDVAREETVLGLGFNPRGPESNIYRLDETGLCLVGTSEITLGGYYQSEVIPVEDLPVKLAGFSHCFRREAGAAGQYSKGLYRVHQFSKVEMFIFSHPEESERMHTAILEIEERIFQELGIPYRVVDVCTGDLGGPAFRKYDLEAWMPGRGESGGWGEITSASNCTDYQARRLGIRFRENRKNKFVHMLNGTAIAVSRALIALLENYQNEDASVTLPEVLHKYAGFSTIPAD